MTAHATATADTAGLEPATSHCVDTVVDAGALPFRAMRPVILFWLGNLTQWWADRCPLLTAKVSGFRGRTNLDCRIVVLHHEVSAVRAPEFLTDIARTAVGNMAILTRASHLSGVLTIASFFRYGVKKEHQGSHPLSAAVAAKEKELTLSRTTLLCEAWSGFDAICGVKSRS